MALQAHVITSDGEAEFGTREADQVVNQFMQRFRNQGLTGRQAFKQAQAELNNFDKYHIERSLFNRLRQPEQQIWLKAAGVPLLTAALYVGGKAVAEWSQLSDLNKQRMAKTMPMLRTLARELLA